MAGDHPAYSGPPQRRARWQLSSFVTSGRLIGGKIGGNNRTMVDQNIASLIEESCSRSEAEAFASFRPNQQQKDQLVQVGTGILRDCQSLPGSCMMMSALFVQRLRKATGAPAYVIAGALSVGGVGIFGYRDATPAGKKFDVSDPSWDGHAWVMFGPLIADPSLLRTARSPRAHPVLHRHVSDCFGERAALLIDRFENVHQQGFEYSPRSVLTDREIQGIADGARALFGTN